jgi:predicted amidohydrolase YtcJ
MSSMPAAGLRPGPDVANPADIATRNTRIYTGNRAQHVGANTRIIDGPGRRVIPDLNDSHMHIIRGATGRGAVGGE